MSAGPGHTPGRTRTPRTRGYSLDDLEGAVEDQDQPEDGGEREEGVDRPDEAPQRSQYEEHRHDVVPDLPASGHQGSQARLVDPREEEHHADQDPDGRDRPLVQ